MLTAYQTDVFVLVVDLVPANRLSKCSRSEAHTFSPRRYWSIFHAALFPLPHARTRTSGPVSQSPAENTPLRDVSKVS